jgi:membrane protein DedA with SNARE-associated domain
VLDLGEAINHWGYLAIFLLIVLGNMGLPIPEESLLAVAGYLVWRGQLRFSVTLVIGIVSAAAGDNLGYWIGRRYGRVAVERYSRRLLVSPERWQTLGCFVMKHGVLGVFAA